MDDVIQCWPETRSVEATGLSGEITEEEVSLSCAASEEAPRIKEEPCQALCKPLTHQHVSKENGHFQALCFVQVCYEATDNSNVLEEITQIQPLSVTLSASIVTSQKWGTGGKIGELVGSAS